MDVPLAATFGQLPQANRHVDNATSAKQHETSGVHGTDNGLIINNGAHVVGHTGNHDCQSTDIRAMLNDMGNHGPALGTNHITGVDVPKYLRHRNADVQRIVPPKVKVNSINLDELDGDSILSASMTLATAAAAGQPEPKPRMPDGGFGWVIVFASFIISVIIDGIAFSFGLIYTELLSYFKQSKTKTAWIGAFHLAVPLLAGPILSNLVDKYGCRTMTIIGGLVAGIGFVLSSLSNSVEMLYLTFGLISGLGIGIGYVTAVVSIAFWFDKKRESFIRLSKKKALMTRTRLLMRAHDFVFRTI